jgi:hypothetical protein
MVQGKNLGLRVLGAGFRAHYLWFVVCDLGFRVQGLGSRVQGLSLRVQSVASRKFKI